MKSQSYQNHVRFYAPHHFVFYPVVLLMLVGSIYLAASRPEERLIWTFISALILLAGWLSFMLRQHYALTLQNRIVKLELNYRYFVLTGKRLEIIAPQLTEAQMFALRFAGDEELPSLVDKALQEQLNADKIKQSVTNWKADNMRV